MAGWDAETPDDIRRKRLRGRGSAYLGRVLGTEVFLPWRDWLVTFLVLGLLFQAMLTFDSELRRQGAVMLFGFLGAAIMVRAVLYQLGTILAALVCRLRISALQVGPARRSGRFVTFADRGRAFFFFHLLRNVPMLLGYWVAEFAFAHGAGALVAIIGQLCLISLAFSLLPLSGSDGHRAIQSLVWWLTGSVQRAKRWGGVVCLVLCVVLGWYALVSFNAAPPGADAFLWLVAMVYLFLAFWSHVGSSTGASRLRSMATTPLAAVVRPLAVAVPGTCRLDYPRHVAVVALGADGQVLGLADDSADPTRPVTQRLLPMPPGAVELDPSLSVAEAYLGMFDEGCDGVLVESDGRYAVLTFADCVAVARRSGLEDPAHLGVA